VVEVWCEACGVRQAYWRLSFRRHGTEAVELNLCPECARRKELSEFAPNLGFSLTSVLESLGGETKADPFVCPKCRQDIEDLVRQGRAGCQNCYTAFRGEVEELLLRAIGRARHVGKVPHRG